MATQNEHGRLIAAAAKAALAPIGCFRRGQSRVWLSDERYWAIMVEFQPSGFSKGSYLNVGASWLWSETRGPLVFNVDYRVGDAGFIAFENAAQFSRSMTKMAERAADRVLALRARFPSIASISDYLQARPKVILWDFYHAAVAAALDGDYEKSRRLLRQIEEFPGEFAWEAELQIEAAGLFARLGEPVELRLAIGHKIDRIRAATHFPRLVDCLEGV